MARSMIIPFSTQLKQNKEVVNDYYNKTLEETLQ